MPDRLPVPDGFWPFLREFRERLRQEGVRLTYPQIGGALGYSPTRIKQLIGGWEQHKNEQGQWRMRPPRDNQEDDVADGEPGTDEGVRG